MVLQYKNVLSDQSTLISRYICTNYQATTSFTDPLLMSDIFNRLIDENHEEASKCVLLVNVQWQDVMPEESESSFSDALTVTSFGATNISGELMARAGKMCPHRIMRFASVKEASGFLDVYGNNLRFTDVLIGLI